jgi:hypothetical protein
MSVNWYGYEAVVMINRGESTLSNSVYTREISQKDPSSARFQFGGGVQMVCKQDMELIVASLMGSYVPDEVIRLAMTRIYRGVCCSPSYHSCRWVKSHTQD